MARCLSLAAVGLAQLKYIGPIFEARAAIDQLYRQLLTPVAGIALSKVARRTYHNYSYFPVFVGPEYSISRDELYRSLQAQGVYGRRYFYPLIPEFAPYNSTAPFDASKYPVAVAASQQVICLPLYPELMKTK